MDLKSFIEMYTTAAIDNGKVAKIEEVYGVELPEEIKHFVSACDSHISVSDEDGDYFDAFSFDEIVQTDSVMVSECVANKMIPLLNCYDNDFAVYRFNDECWAMFSTSDREFYYENESLEDYINEVYLSDEDGDENAEDDDLQSRVNKALQGLNLPEGSFKMMDIFEAAENGFASAQNEVAFRYHDGDGVEQSDEEAFKWWMKAAEQEYPEALFSVGNCFQTGMGVEEDMEKAVDYWMRAADKGHGVSQYFIGVCYYNGMVLEKDPDKAFEWWKKAAEQEVPEAELNMGMFCMDGDFMPQSDEGAVKWFRKAAEHGSDEGSYQLALCYMDGRGVKVDFQMAEKYFKDALEQGNDQAQEALDKLKEIVSKQNRQLFDAIRGKNLIKVVDFLNLINACRQSGADFLWCPSNIKVLHASELTRIGGPSDFEDDVVLLDKKDIYPKFKETMSDEELDSYNFYLLKGSLSSQFAFKR